MDEIGTFLARAVPWPTEDAPGYVSVHGPFTTPDGRNVMPGRAFTDLRDAVRHVHSRRHNTDLYLCMSLQSETAGQDSRGLKARRRRNNALLLNDLYIDVDIKDGFFHDTRHAAEECEKWRLSTGLPEFSMFVLT